MTVAVVRTTWTGGPSSPGLTQFVLEAGAVIDFSAALAAVQTFWTGIMPMVTNQMSVQVESRVDLYSESTGQLSGEFVHSPTKPAITGGSAGSYAAGVGCRIDWNTSDIKNGRRVRGRTFLVPIESLQFETNGTIAEATRTGLAAEAQDLLTALDAAGTPLVVWSRPSLAHPVGEYTPVVAATIPDKAAILRGRRD